MTTAIVENYCAVVIRGRGQGVDFGAMRVPVGEATLGGDHILPLEEMSIEPLDYIIIWEQSHRKIQFQQLGFRIVGDGALTVFSRYDLPTSADDFTAAGSRKRWRNENWPCKMQPWWACDQTAYSLSSLTDEVADDAGLPRLMGVIGTADTAVCDKVLLYNPGETDPVLIEKLLLR